MRPHDASRTRRANKRWAAQRVHGGVFFVDRAAANRATWVRVNTGAPAFTTGAVAFTLFDPAVPECLASPKMPLRTAAAEIQYWCDLTAIGGGYVLAAGTGPIYFERTQWARRKRLYAFTPTNSTGAGVTPTIGATTPRVEMQARYSRWHSLSEDT